MLCKVVCHKYQNNQDCLLDLEVLSAGGVSCDWIQTQPGSCSLFETLSCMPKFFFLLVSSHHQPSMHFYYSSLLLLVVLSVYYESPQHAKTLDSLSFNSTVVTVCSSTSLGILAPVPPQNEVFEIALPQNRVFEIVLPQNEVLESVLAPSGVFKFVLPQNEVCKIVIPILNQIKRMNKLLLNLRVQRLR